MSCSPAKLEANRRNAARSTGPKTPEGKAASRAYAYKHGMTGEGIVLAEDDAGEVESRLAQLEDEMHPSGLLGRMMLRRVAVMSVRLDRCARHEAATIAKRSRDAAEAHDDARMAYVESMGDLLAAEPATHLRRLKGMPEGIDWLIRAWRGLKVDLFHPTQDSWNGAHWHRAENLMGRRSQEIPASEISILSRAAWGDLSGLGDDQGTGLADRERRDWAREELGRRIDAEIAALESLRPSLDRSALDRDRAEAADRALFDPSKEAVLARKYENAAERSLFRALNEFRRAEAEAEVRAVEVPAPAATVPDIAEEPTAPDSDETPNGDRPEVPRRRLGSSFPRTSTSPLIEGPARIAGGPAWRSGGRGPG